MKNIKNSVKVGALITVGLALLLIIIFVIGSKQNLFTSTVKLSSVFKNVSGLKDGGNVNFSGIKIGVVKEIRIQNTDEILVIMEIEAKILPFIKKDSKVSVVSEGLVGNKIIEISSGTPASGRAEDKDYLESTIPISVEDIMKSLKETGENSSKMTTDLADILRKVNEGKGTLGKLINDESLYNYVDSTLKSVAGFSVKINSLITTLSSSVVHITSNIDDFTVDLKTITTNIAEVTKKINSSQSLVGTLLTDTIFANNLKSIIVNANATTKNLEDGTFSFAQNMEALKHNFFFKGYFEDLGYWDRTNFEQNLDKKQQDILKKGEELKALEKKLTELENLIKAREIELKNRDSLNNNK